MSKQEDTPAADPRAYDRFYDRGYARGVDAANLAPDDPGGAEEHSRCYADFSGFAAEMNALPEDASELAWEAYERGVTDGIAGSLPENSPDPLYAVVSASVWPPEHPDEDSWASAELEEEKFADFELAVAHAHTLAPEFRRGTFYGVLTPGGDWILCGSIAPARNPENWDSRKRRELDPEQGKCVAVRARVWPPEWPIERGEGEELGSAEDFWDAYTLACDRVSHLSRSFYGVRTPGGDWIEIGEEDFARARAEDRHNSIGARLARGETVVI